MMRCGGSGRGTPTNDALLCQFEEVPRFGGGCSWQYLDLRLEQFNGVFERSLQQFVR